MTYGYKNWRTRITLGVIWHRTLRSANLKNERLKATCHLRVSSKDLNTALPVSRPDAFPDVAINEGNLRLWTEWGDLESCPQNHLLNQVPGIFVSFSYTSPNKAFFFFNFRVQ